MATYVVTNVRKEVSLDGTHRHIEGGCTAAGLHYTRKDVVESIDDGNTWRTKADGSEAIIHKVSRCPQDKCTATPYIETNPDSTKKDNLEHLDAC